MPRLASIPTFALLTLLGSATAQAQLCETDCANVCTYSSICSEACTVDCENWTSCGAAAVCNIDPDGDGYSDGSDNCPLTYNPNQANCDGDVAGDVCDSENAIYQQVGSTQWCHIVGRNHFGYVDVQLHIEAFQEDVSSCGSPDRWVNYEGPKRSCSWPSTQWDCCVGFFGQSSCITYLNQNYCH